MHNEVPHFKLAAQRAGRTSTLLVPASLAAPARHSRLLAFLGKEKWAVAGGALPPLRSGGAGDASAEQLHAAELLFVRDVLGPLRRRATTPVPEKVVGTMLGVGVKALHQRCRDLFGCEWLEFARSPGDPPPAPLAYLPPPPAPEPSLPMAPAVPAPSAEPVAHTLAPAPAATTTSGSSDAFCPPPIDGDDDDEVLLTLPRGVCCGCSPAGCACEEFESGVRCGAADFGGACSAELALPPTPGASCGAAPAAAAALLPPPKPADLERFLAELASEAPAFGGGAPDAGEPSAVDALLASFDLPDCPMWEADPLDDFLCAGQTGFPPACF